MKNVTGLDCALIDLCGGKVIVMEMGGLLIRKDGTLRKQSPSGKKNHGP
jgi:hypothetical protein